MKVLKRASSSDISKLFFSPIVMLLFIGLFSFSGLAQNCNAELRVLKNRTARSASENDGTQFTLQLVNNATSAQTFTILAERSNKSFKVKGKVPKRLGPNYTLNTTILQNKRATQQITVAAGATATFQVLVTVPQNTPVDHWGGIDVTATAASCSSNGVSTLLRLYVRDASVE
ncbi:MULTISPECIES: FixG Ig-like domain-containing protein [Altibacter]|uniref:FixG Ig-like domain-containing protein n=1 Tax=Altibacter TaxID=1535231 RepID=UPI0005521DE9|nr:MULTISPECIES: FixG Ig-like domain-containing protein [Altibacter]MCW9037200.1 hypothetical protein [Altibacter sp.]